MRYLFLILLLILILLRVFAGASPARACDLALILAVDVSGSVDEADYATQRDGLARALSDSVVREALVAAQARVTIVQWTGASRQRVTVPWMAIDNHEAALDLAARAAADPRVWEQYSTAIGELMALSLKLFEEVPECRRRVIDISGDGVSNEGREPTEFRGALTAAGIVVNAVVIETEGRDLRDYFWENVIHGEGAFVVMARGFEDYAERIKQKLIREVADQVSSVPKERPEPKPVSFRDHTFH